MDRPDAQQKNRSSRGAGAVAVAVLGSAAVVVALLAAVFVSLKTPPRDPVALAKPTRGEEAVALPDVPEVPERRACVTGIVRNASTGRPISNLTVDLCLHGDAHHPNCTTDTQGRFRIDRRAQEDMPYQVVINVPGFREYASEDLSLAAGKNVDLEIFLALRRTMVRGTVRDARTGAPLVHAAVRVGFDLGEAMIGQAAAHAGKYELEAAPGRLEVRASAPGYADASETFELAGGQERTVDLALRRIDATVTGVCLDAGSNRPVCGVKIDVCVNEWPDFVVESDGDGRFELKAPAGAYEVLATKDGYRPEKRENVRTTDGSATVKIRLARLDATIAGRIFDRSTGRPSRTPVEVHVEPLDAGYTDADMPLDYPAVDFNRTARCYRAAVAAGRFVVRVMGPGYLRHESEVTVAARESRTVDVGLVPRPPESATLRGFVEMESGEPFAGATVSISLGRTVVASARSAVDGSFDTKVPAGELGVTACGSRKVGRINVHLGGEAAALTREGKVTEILVQVRPRNNGE